jgi:hypothetical protein
MKLDDLELAVTLQKKAYGLLLWLKQQARHQPNLLKPEQVEEFESGDKCVEWTARHLAEFPSEFRPDRNAVRAFGYLLSSFFSTSFRVAETRFWDDVRTTLVVGAKEFKGRRHKRHSERREREAADELKCLALAALADEHGLSASADLRERAFTSAEPARDLTLWTYGCEIVRRTQFASQGSAVHRLWLELDEKVRKDLSAEPIWQARERFVLWLTNNQARDET